MITNLHHHAPRYPNRLLSMTENFTARLLPIFPRNTREEIDLYNSLARAYSDARYKEGYQVNDRKINVLIERVKAFQDKAEKIYNDQLAQIKNFGLYPSVYDVQKPLPYEN